MTVENFNKMTWITLSRKKIYPDTLNDTIYYCDARHGTLLTEPFWKVTKMVETATEQTVTSTANYNNLATDLSTVQSLTYS